MPGMHNNLLARPLSLPSGGSLKNRIAKGAMTEGLADEHNRATARHATIYRRWAEGGAGLLLTGNVMVDRRYLERPGNVAIDGPQTDEQMRALRAWAQAARDGGADIWMQISHAGRQSPKIVATEPVAPSAVKLRLPGGTFAKPRALTGAEVENVISRFVHTASVAKQTGFTGVQIHAAHGYRISEFLNPLVNLRDDAGKEWRLGETKYSSLRSRWRLFRDIIFRRTEIGADGYPGQETIAFCAQVMAEQLAWTPSQTQQEIAETTEFFAPALIVDKKGMI